MSRPRYARARRQGGFALMMAIFLLVSLAAIGVYLLTISNAQVEAGVQDEQGARAYQAARTGIDWGAYQLRVSSVSGFKTTCVAGAPASQTLTLAQGLAGFYVQVACLRVGNETEGAVGAVPVTVGVYRITATGCNRSPCGGAIGPTYAERQLQLTLTNFTE